MVLFVINHRMAESNELKSDLSTATCKICNELYTHPLVLPCLHAFCKQCLLKTVEDSKLVCPSCNEPHQVDIKSLPKDLWLVRKVKEVEIVKKMSESERKCDKCIPNLSEISAVAFCFECHDLLCKACKSYHMRAKETVDHKLIELSKDAEAELKKEMKDSILPMKNKALNCPEHTEEDLSFYCTSCEVLACRDCLLISHRADSHKCVSATNESIDKSSQFQAGLQDCSSVITSLSYTIKTTEKVIQSIESREKGVEKEINDTFTMLKKELAKRRDSLLAENAKIAKSKKAVVNMQLESFKKQRNETLHGREYAKNACATYQARELLSIKKVTDSRLKHCKAEYDNLPHDLIESEFVRCTLVPKPLVDKISHFGTLSTVDPAQCAIVSGLALPLATMNKERKLKLVIKDSSRGLVDGKYTPVKVQVVSPSAKYVDVNLLHEQNTSSTISFTPTTAGPHSLSVKVRGEEIQGSPHTIWVRTERDLSTLNTTASHFNGVQGTHGVAVHSNGEVFATSFNGGYVQLFTNDGKTKQRIGEAGSGDGQFNCPWGIALVKDVLYVTDYNNHRIQKFTTTGKYIDKFGENGSGHGQFNHPAGIAYNGKDQLLVADYTNQRIQILNLDGTYITSIKFNGNAFDVAIDNDGNIHVPIYNQHVIQVYTPDGKTMIDEYIDPGTCKCCQNHTGIAIDENGYRYILSYTNNAIHTGRSAPQYSLQIIDPAGKRVKSIPCSTGHGIAIDTEGSVYIAEHNNSRVLKLK